MPELRWALGGLGLLFLAGLALWEWRRAGRRNAGRGLTQSGQVIEAPDRARRLEPSIDGMKGHAGTNADDALEVPTIHPVEPVLVGVAVESAVDIPAAARFESQPAAVPVQWPPHKAERVLSLRVVSARGEPLHGRQLRFALEAAGLVHGPQMIYHRTTADGAVLVSAANLVRPGNLDPAVMDAQEFRGLSLFSVLPGPLPAVRMLEELVALARGLAHQLSAVVQDEHGADLDGMRLTELRRSLPDETSPGGGEVAP